MLADGVVCPLHARVLVRTYLQLASYSDVLTRGTLCAGDSSLSSQLDLAHAQVCCTSHICTRYCATVINGAVHSKYTEDKLADSFCEPDSEKNSVSKGSSFRLL